MKYTDEYRTKFNETLTTKNKTERENENTRNQK